ncbi:putative zinc-binding peptidase [Azospirillum sp. A1-3]|uniref:zinc-binding metallopeptidase family protein n=1 Tax=Azospirillum sp. A1-3 TaxID=185874 RepID=UPI0020773B8E|nr:putative zinc-binding peptidase [Azospirillum sp. A1-3]MCM8737201.1 putative zinc-binding peptidase [Azospirillum sp. A1-3]
MKLFECQNCHQPLYFENTLCERCGHRLGYLPDVGTLSALDPTDHDGVWSALATPEPLYKFCANAELDACNWMLPADSADTHCAACRHNRTIPDLSDTANLTRWRKLELAKHHLFYTLTNLKLPLQTRIDNPEEGLAFDFLSDTVAADGTVTPVLTGHANGLITINVAEADDAEREKRRTEMGEPYRTLLGHFRHESGHYIWDRLVRDDPALLERFRALFGDERQDYGEALKRHYADGAPADWQANFVSTYATAHPWEDFAETWAHYLHIVDTLETARAFGLRVRPRITEGAELEAEVDFNPHKARRIEDLIDLWLPLTYAVNSLNRSMGQPDLYPFILSAAVIEKLGFMNGMVRGLEGR